MKSELIDSLIGESSQDISLPRKRGRKPLPGYDERSAQAQIMSRKRAAGRDVDVPQCANPSRRAACAQDLEAFCYTYFPHLYSWKSAPYQTGRRTDIQHAVFFGGQDAKAHPRGGGKTTDAEIGGLWALLYGHRRHFFVICKSDEAAREIIVDIKRELETNDLLAADFPEVCVPVQALEGAPARANAQTVNGHRTRMRYRETGIVFPDIEGSVCSGSILSTSGLRGNRGHKINGQRPDFVFLDDLESEESAASPTMTATIRNMVLKDVGGLGGPGVDVATLWRGTIILRGCLIDQYTDRGLHPEWQGGRQATIITWPDRVDLWEEYLDVYRDGMREVGEKSDPSGRGAMAFYRAHQSEMDAGAVVAWPENYSHAMAPDGTPQEISALQRSYNIILRLGLDSFMTEYQNDPPEEDKASAITANMVALRLSGHPEFVAPDGLDDVVVQGIDIGGREMHYVIGVWSKTGTGSIIDYGILDVQSTGVGDRRKLTAAGRGALEEAILESLRWRRGECASGEMYTNAKGDPLYPALTFIDAGWMKDAVFAFCRESGPSWQPSMGRQLRAGNRKYSLPKTDTSQVRDATSRVQKFRGAAYYHREAPKGEPWRWYVDADYWKLYVHERFLQDPGTRGALSLFGENSRDHRRFAKHIVAEEWNPDGNRWTQVHKYNHFLDCTALMCAAAHKCGVRILPEGVRPQVNTEHRRAEEGAGGWLIGR